MTIPWTDGTLAHPGRKVYYVQVPVTRLNPDNLLLVTYPSNWTARTPRKTFTLDLDIINRKLEWTLRNENYVPMRFHSVRLLTKSSLVDLD
jgi:hypothetical protein